ncbi:MAG: tetratricopeptide repeat protein [Actinomycetota bacterium]|nr:tetratricopeptide repeat protein [Actinomycetota bacterium]
MTANEAGTFTFVFTDVEGSTRLWEADPEAMRGAIGGHDSLLAELVGFRGGQIFANVGDGICAAFRSAADAVETCTAAQLAFSREDWGVPGPFRVRMAVHEAPAVRQADDFESSPELILCARMLAVAHGGQILVSEPTAASLEPLTTISLKDLGRHRLKDLTRPVRVYQVAHPDLPADFPPLRSRNLSHNLPADLASFVGREDALGTLATLLGERRLVTVVGPGGCGKTRVAIRAAREAMDRFRDGVWLVELAALSDPLLVTQQVATVLGIRDDANRIVGATAELAERLDDKELLVVLDNCEHLVEASARLVSDLLQLAPHVRVLATSQQPLGISGEALYTLPPMQLLPSDAERLDPLGYEAARLFLDRVESAGVSLQLDDATSSAIADICRRLDGLPLALELAAARTSALSVTDIAALLEDRFRLLTTGHRDGPPRHQTLSAAVEWSYRLLGEDERQLFDRLSVFRGGATLEAVRSVCGDPSSAPDDVVAALTELVTRSLVIAHRPASRSIRYDQLETLRAYGHERLRAARAEDAFRRAHAEYFVDLAGRGDSELRGPRQRQWLERLDDEQSNLRAAVDWAIETDRAELALGLVGSLWWYWFRRGLWQEGRRALEGVLDLPTRDGRQRLRALCGAALFCTVQNDYERARALVAEGLGIATRSEDAWAVAWLESIAGELAWYERDFDAVRVLSDRSLSAFAELDDRWGMAWVNRLAGQAEGTAGNVAVATDRHSESLRLFRELGDSWGMAWQLYFLGAASRSTGDYVTAEKCCGEALDLFEEQGEGAGTAHVLQERAEVARLQELYADAEALYSDSLALLRDLGDKHCSAASLTGLGLTAHATGDLDEAVARFLESLSLCIALDHGAGAAWALQGLAGVFTDSGDRILAVEVLAHVEMLRTSSGSPLSGHDRTAFEEVRSRLEATVPQKDFDAAWQRGAESSTERMLDEITDSFEARAGPTGRPAQAGRSGRRIPPS